MVGYEDSAGRAMDDIDGHALPEDIEAIADRYDDTIGIRDRFLWKWFHFLNPRFRLSMVDDRYAEKVRNDKSRLTFYVTLVDDLIDERNDRVTFWEAAKIPFGHQQVNFERNGVDQACLGLAYEVWDELERSLEAAPRFEEFADLFRFDLRQTLNATRYSYVVNNHPYAANMTEAYAHGAHNMSMFGFADIDLMHSRTLDREKCASLRTALCAAQRMARIGNWVSTWRRELRQGDFSSGVLICARQYGLVTDAELQQLCADPLDDTVETVQTRIERAGIEEALLGQWRRYYELLEDTPELDTVDLKRMLDGMETVLRFHLDSEGLK